LEQAFAQRSGRFAESFLGVDAIEAPFADLPAPSLAPPPAPQGRLTLRIRRHPNSAGCLLGIQVDSAQHLVVLVRRPLQVREDGGRPYFGPARGSEKVWRSTAAVSSPFDLILDFRFSAVLGPLATPDPACQAHCRQADDTAPQPAGLIGPGSVSDKQFAIGVRDWRRAFRSRTCPSLGRGDPTADVAERCRSA
jgi:hypothetical protein